MKTKLERIRYDIDELAKISVTQGPGCCRQTYTKEFAEARDYIVNAMKEIGLRFVKTPLEICLDE
ncbi:MAG: hypothetical protein IJO13_00200 [Lachnospiraceae bacterium]|nr:hypothetical protein [Lachnospiraceae bacterium]